MASSHLPFLAEYAKTGRASCKGCKTLIPKDSLRLAQVVQSPFHDGVLTKWFHENCFFSKARPKTIGDIENFDNIRWEDQEKIRAKIEGADDLDSSSATGSSGKKASKRKQSNANRDFTVEYAKSNRSTCKGCEAPIIKGELRISKKDFDSEMGQKFSGVDAWHHTDCFAKIRHELGFFDSGDALPGFKTITSEDKQTILKKLPKIKEADIPPAAKKVKKEPVDKNEDKLMKKQNDMIFKLKDQLATLTKKELISLLQENDQHIPEGQAAIIENLADLMSFGIPNPCDKCSGSFKYVSGVGYKCTGNLTEWTRCEEVNHDPKRSKFKIPEDMKSDIPFLSSFKPKIGKRIFRVTATSTSMVIKKEEKDGPKVVRGPLPLKGMQFLIHGSTTQGMLKKDKDELKKKIMLLGGTVSSKVHENLAAVISTYQAFDDSGRIIDDAKVMDIQVVTEDFVDEAKDYTGTPISLILKKNIAPWGSDPSTRVSVTMAKSTSRGKSVYEKSSSGKIKLKIKGGGAVDPDSGLDDYTHIYTNGEDKYTATLGLTDIQTGSNKYYKLQLLKTDHCNEYWLFRSWGRIGTTIGGKKCEEMPLENAIREFEKHYHEKSGNAWRNRKFFVKVPNKMYPIDVDGADDDLNMNTLESDIKSNLKKPVQDLMRLIFNVELMKNVMKEYELDTEKMPLGKLSKTQLQKAYGVLAELQALVSQGESAERTRFIDATNRFYTLVPHSFGVAAPTILDNEAIIKAKIEMVDSLIEMEIACNLLSVKTEAGTNPLDAHYKQLNTNIDVLDKNSEQFKIIEEYTKNTHAATHNMYNLAIEDVFVIKRQGEDKKFKPFKKLPNRKLLWHGSRTTNFAGILSQGLRIAPPEAPVTGYMFGKGIYFADMVSKSANYCCTSNQNSTGLLMLCEVALGNMYERLSSEYVEKLPKGKHSTFGMGHTTPDPAKARKTEDGVEIPCGPGIPATLPGPSALLYNEYIVYDVAQVQAKYLVRMNFKYDY